MFSFRSLLDHSAPGGPVYADFKTLSKDPSSSPLAVDEGAGPWVVSLTNPVVDAARTLLGGQRDCGGPRPAGEAAAQLLRCFCLITTARLCGRDALLGFDFDGPICLLITAIYQDKGSDL